MQLVVCFCVCCRMWRRKCMGQQRHWLLMWSGLYTTVLSTMAVCYFSVAVLYSQCGWDDTNNDGHSWFHATRGTTVPVLSTDTDTSCVCTGSTPSGVVRIDTLHFLARCCTRRLNQALSVLSLSLDFFDCVYCAVNWSPFLHCVILCYLCVLFLGCSC